MYEEQIGYINLLSSVIVFYATTSAGHGSRGSIVLPPVDLGPHIPTCTSYDSLCHLAYNITEKGIGQIFNTHSQICRCPGGLKCPVNWEDMSNSFIRSFRSDGEEMQVKVSYCKMNVPEKKCRQNEPAVILRGRGPFQFEIFQDFRCKCNRPLYAHQSWRDGPYDYFVYSCGKARCSFNRHPERQCTQVTYIGEENYQHDYLCRCKWHEECKGNTLPTAKNPVTYNVCQSMYHVGSLRTKHRQHIRPKFNRRKRHSKKNT